MSRYTSMARCHNCGHEEGEHAGKVPHYGEITACKVCDCEGFTREELSEELIEKALLDAAEKYTGKRELPKICGFADVLDSITRRR